MIWMNDQYDIMRCHDSLVRQINVLCFFRKLDSVTKFRLLITYSFSLYGFVLWNFCNGYVESVYRAWTVGVRRVWGLPSNAHSVLLPLLCCRLPLYDELIKRLLTFTHKCFNYDNKLKLVNFMVIW